MAAGPPRMQRKCKTPIKILVVLLLVAVFWFFVIFTYMDDLDGKEHKDTQIWKMIRFPRQHQSRHGRLSERDAGFFDHIDLEGMEEEGEARDKKNIYNKTWLPKPGGFKRKNPITKPPKLTEKKSDRKERTAKFEKNKHDIISAEQKSHERQKIQNGLKRVSSILKAAEEQMKGIGVSNDDHQGAALSYRTGTFAEMHIKYPSGNLKKGVLMKSDSALNHNKVNIANDLKTGINHLDGISKARVNPMPRMILPRLNRRQKVPKPNLLEDSSMVPEFAPRNDPPPDSNGDSDDNDGYVGHIGGARKLPIENNGVPLVEPNLSKDKAHSPLPVFSNKQNGAMKSNSLPQSTPNPSMGQHHPIKVKRSVNGRGAAIVTRGAKKRQARVVFPADAMKLTGATSKDYTLDLKNGLKRHSFNVAASEKIHLDRQLPVTKTIRCGQPAFNLASLSKVSVIICFHNEAWSTLLRTVHSVLKRTPASLLVEVILVDDYSTYDYLGATLESYLVRLSKVLLVRTKQREGLTRARLLGVSYAKGPVLVFLDSHCECNDHWVEPLLQAIAKDRKRIVCPEIDIIDAQTLHYNPAPVNLHGGFNWRLQYTWNTMPTSYLGHPGYDLLKPTPTMIGGIFAVDKAFFEQLGTYDPGMKVWGGENLELSFRTWMCGGSMWIAVCSRVGHIFRREIPYSFPGGHPRKTILENNMRVAEVWMDQYKRYFYAAQNVSRDNAILASVADRRRLRQQLDCHSFEWYLTNVVPQMDVPPLDAPYYGEVRNEATDQCLDSQGLPGAPVLMLDCHHEAGNQLFYLTLRGQLVHRGHCVDTASLQQGNQLVPCEKVTQSWHLNNRKQLQTQGQDGAMVCLESHIKNEAVTLTSCNEEAPLNQQWTFSYHFDLNKIKTEV